MREDKSVNVRPRKPASAQRPNDRAYCEKLLSKAFGPDARFREGQWEAIEAVLQSGARNLVVQRTGWGKSAVYFLAARLFRKRKEGPTLIVSPLLALMRNQIEMAAKLGLRAVSFTSDNAGEWESCVAELQAGKVDVALVAPERLSRPEFAETALPYFFERGRLLVIDEAHCLSEWGHDFRPDYRKIVSIASRFPSDASLLATTATATSPVIEDLMSLLGGGWSVQKGDLNRTNLRLLAYRLPSPAARLAWLDEALHKLPEVGVIYSPTIFDAEQTAAWLSHRGHKVLPYHSELLSDERLHAEELFSANQLKALVATSALGMGYDKEDIGFVVHARMPGSVLQYYQQAGRAGRKLRRAIAVLLASEGDRDIQLGFIERGSPPARVFDSIHSLLTREPIPKSELVRLADAPQVQVLHALEILEAQGALLVEDDALNWRPDASPPDPALFESLRKRRLRELDDMERYVETADCRMSYLLSALGQDPAEDCGQCDRCRNYSSFTPSPDSIEAAAAFLDRELILIRVPKQAPLGAKTKGRKGLLATRKVAEGVALSFYGEPGRGEAVQAGKYVHDEYGDDLLVAALKAIESVGWTPDWITWAPHASQRKALESFANRLAQSLGIECRGVIEREKRVLPQKENGSEVRQFENVWGRFSVRGEIEGTVLLLDDIVDSGWTLAAISAALVEAGATSVYPLALATSRRRSRRSR